MPFLKPEDLAPFAEVDAAKAAAMIEDAESMASLVAPCISDPEFAADTTLAAALKAVLRRAILRWNDAGTGALTQMGAGSFQISNDNRTPLRGLFWPSEIDQLRDLCARFTGARSSGAFTVDMTGVTSSSNPLYGAAINANLGHEPLGEWSDETAPYSGEV